MLTDPTPYSDPTWWATCIVGTPIVAVMLLFMLVIVSGSR